MQVGQQQRITNELLVAEARSAREISGGPKVLRMDTKSWEDFIKETPYAPYFNRGRMTYYSCKIIIDDSIEGWRFE